METERRDADPFGALLDRMTTTPALDKLSRFAAAWKKDEADEAAEHERRMQDRQDEMLAAMLADREAS